MKVKPKKTLGQHFLKNEQIAFQVVNYLKCENCSKLYEIGPGMGVLTQFLLKKELPIDFEAIDIDPESVDYLRERFPTLQVQCRDFLEVSLDTPCCLIGNLPYNVASLILFKVYENQRHVYESVFMLQKEVAERICARPGSKSNGVLSILLQAYFRTEYLLTVGPEEFTPVPKVHSAVIRLIHSSIYDLPCNAALFKKVVKTAFGQRRKTLKNSLQELLPSNVPGFDRFSQKRAEQLGVDDFFELTQLVENSSIHNPLTKNY